MYVFTYILLYIISYYATKYLVKKEFNEWSWKDIKLNAILSFVLVFPIIWSLIKPFEKFEEYIRNLLKTPPKWL